MALETDGKERTSHLKILYNMGMTEQKSFVIHTHMALKLQIPIGIHNPDKLLIALQKLNPSLYTTQNMQGEFLITARTSISLNVDDESNKIDTN